MLIIEDYLLLIHDDTTGKPLVSTGYLEQVAAGGLLVELTLLERIVPELDRRGRAKRVHASSDEPTGNPLLDEALAVVAARPRAPQSMIGAVAKLKPARRALAHLAEAGVLREDRSHVLGLFPVTHWPARDTAATAAVRDRVRDVLVAGRDPDARTAAVVSLLSALDQASKVVRVPEGSGLRRRDITRRAKEIAAGEWAGAAVARYVQDMTAALVAVMAATTSSAASSS